MRLGSGGRKECWDFYSSTSAVRSPGPFTHHKFMVRFSQSLIEVCGLCMKEGSNMGNILVEERINLYK